MTIDVRYPLGLDALVAAMPPESVAGFEELMHIQHFDDGALVHGPAKPSRSLFKIVEGRVRFSNVSSDGKAVDLARLGPGQWFGEIALLASLPPPHDAHADGDIKLGVVGESAFRSVIMNDPEAGLAVMQLMARRLINAFEIMDDLRTLSARDRLVKYLAWLVAQEHSEDDDDAVRLEINQTNLAAGLGLSRVTVGEILKALKREGCLTIGYGHLKIFPSKLSF